MASSSHDRNKDNTKIHIKDENNLITDPNIPITNIFNI